MARPHLTQCPFQPFSSRSNCFHFPCLLSGGAFSFLCFFVPQQFCFLGASGSKSFWVFSGAGFCSDGAAQVVELQAVGLVDEGFQFSLPPSIAVGRNHLVHQVTEHGICKSDPPRSGQGHAKDLASITILPQPGLSSPRLHLGRLPRSTLFASSPVRLC